MEENKQQPEPPFSDTSQLSLTRLIRLIINTQRERSLKSLVVCGGAGVGESMSIERYLQREKN